MKLYLLFFFEVLALRCSHSFLFSSSTLFNYIPRQTLPLEEFSKHDATSKTTWKWRGHGVIFPYMDGATPFPRHFHVVFDVASCLLNLSINFLRSAHLLCVQHFARVFYIFRLKQCIIKLKFKQRGPQCWNYFLIIHLPYIKDAPLARLFSSKLIFMGYFRNLLLPGYEQN